MSESINSIIDRYKNSEVYEVLKKFYVNNFINKKEYNMILNKIKEVLVSYYLYKYKFKTSYNFEIQDKFLLLLTRYYSFSKKVRYQDEKIKIYPVQLSDEEHKEYYINMIGHMVDYQIETGMDIEKIFDKYTKYLESLLNKYKEKLIKTDMLPYYGCPSYMIGRAKFVRQCLTKIPDFNYDIDYIVNKMEEFEKKYLQDRDTYNDFDEFKNVDEQFYSDYDALERYYKLILRIENELCPVVVEYWKQYLTDPKIHNSNNYKYIMHTFSEELVDPSMMNKACCALNTDELVITPYGDVGLIYEIDVNSLETLCSEDVGSWNCSKKDFVESDCPTRWQLLNPDGMNVWYEFEKNSKLIMPNVLEEECKNENISHNGEVLNYSKGLCYSEIYLNENAKAIGVFYTDNCTNLEEISAYAKKYDLPLINISLIKQRELKGLPMLEKSKNV